MAVALGVCLGHAVLWLLRVFFGVLKVVVARGCLFDDAGKVLVSYLGAMLVYIVVTNPGLVLVGWSSLAQT